ncbi:MAG TPA: toprim domain-containing protein, partial [Gemmatimonadales bacterium]|nr:toprim domain-containing protein [Gemmatimonadales bacterium]
AEPILLEAGLAARRDDGRIVPRFRERLLFPIHDLRGRVVGFGGRLLREGEPKYLNSPETPLFQKGRLLYNLHAARPAIRQQETVLLVEGYFDVLRLILAGVEHVVAGLGTALTPEQAALLRRSAPSATLLYDSDAAGLRATFRAADELLRHGVRVRVATLPPGDDPDTLVRKGGAAALAPVLRDATDVIERKLQFLERGGWMADIERRRHALDKLLPTIRAAADPVTRELYASRVAERLGVSRDVVLEEAARRPSPPPGVHSPAAGPAPSDTRRPRPLAARRPLPAGAGRERQLVTYMIAAPEWRTRAGGEVSADLLEQPVLRELFDALVRLPTTDSGDALPEGLSERAADAWSRLRERANALSGQPLDHEYASVVEYLQARTEYRAMKAIPDPDERLRRRTELDRRYPGFATARQYYTP